MIFQISNKGGNYTDETEFDVVLLVTTNFNSVIELLETLIYPKENSYIYINIWKDDKIIFTNEIELFVNNTKNINNSNFEIVLNKIRKIIVCDRVNKFFFNKIEIPNLENSSYEDLLTIIDFFKIP